MVYQVDEATPHVILAAFLAKYHSASSLDSTQPEWSPSCHCFPSGERTLKSCQRPVKMKLPRAARRERWWPPTERSVILSGTGFRQENTVWIGSHRIRVASNQRENLHSLSHST